MKIFIIYLTAILFTILLSVTVNTILYTQFGVPDIVCSNIGFLIGWNVPGWVLKRLLSEDTSQQ